MSSLCGVYGIPTKFGERNGSGKVNFTKGSIKGTRIFQIPWDEFPGYIHTLLGQQVGTPSGGITLSYPDSFSQQFSFLYCQEVEVAPEDLRGLDEYGKATYQTAVVTATYMPLDDDESIHLSGQMLTLARYRFCWIGMQATNGTTGDGWIVRVPTTAISGTYTLGDSDPIKIGAQDADIEKALESDFGVGNVVVAAFPDDPSENAANYNSYNVMIRPSGDITEVDSSEIKFGVDPELEVTDLNDGSDWLITIKGDLSGGDFTLTVDSNGESSDTDPIEIQQDSNGEVINSGPVIESAIQTALTNNADASETDPLEINVTVVATPDDPRVYQVIVNGSEPIQLRIAEQNLVPVTGEVVVVKNNDPSPLKLDEPPGRYIPHGEYSIERHKVQTTSLTAVLYLLGSCNKTTFLGLPSMTLLLSGVDAKRTYTASGDKCWDISYKFLYNPHTHMALYRPDRSRWEFVKSDGFREAAPEAADLLDINDQPTGLADNDTPCVDYGLIYPLSDYNILLMYF